MSDPGTMTSMTLLRDLRAEGSESAWREIDRRFRPVLTAFAERLGLSVSDAADVAQETLAQFYQDYRAGKYDPRRGRLRSWIFAMAKNRITDAYRRRARRRENRGDSALAGVADDATLSAIWDAEAKAALVKQAMAELCGSNRLAAHTRDAFRLHVIEERPVEEVARELGLSVQAVYVAKHRCLRRLREIVERLTALYEM